MKIILKVNKNIQNIITHLLVIKTFQLFVP